ncbi:phospholipase D family protein [Methylobacterium sp. 77]|uniref:phospholipase D family protein n=1 Tax=Methylobacterium sp. 77 TaxID=1101192 RepID=UPI00036157CB|nr:phospholipase D family protein [Methylobacterium sp. 77]
MARFLDHKQVRSAVQAVIAGDDVRCAVAFWGNGALKALFGFKRLAFRARIICDLSMGGTNPDELVLLGAPENPHLKHLRGLHAKLYLSSAGLVVTSANASNRGIGFVEPAALTECGTFHRPDTTAFCKGAKWFEAIWENAEVVDPKALATARATWAKRPRHGTPKSAPLIAASDTLLRTIAADPDRYRGIGVVFSSGEADHDDVERAAEVAMAVESKSRKPKLKKEEIGRLPNWPKGNLFSGWSDADANAWPRLFLCAHRGARGAVSYWCYSRFFEVKLDRDEWSIFAERSPELRSRIGLAGTPRQSASADVGLLEQIFMHLDAAAGPDEIGYRLCESPVHLGHLLAEVDAGSALDVNLSSREASGYNSAKLVSPLGGE